MKKIIPLFFAMLMLCACSAKTYTPVIDTVFTVNAVYKTGDFSYNCRIDKTDSSICVTPTSTNAKGLLITYDGKNVSYAKDDMKKTFSADTLDKTNPAIVLYDIFSYIENTENLDVKKREDGFEYKGKIDAGEFSLVQKADNSLKSITIQSADISVVFYN